MGDEREVSQNTGTSLLLLTSLSLLIHMSQHDTNQNHRGVKCNGFYLLVNMMANLWLNIDGEPPLSILVIIIIIIIIIIIVVVVVIIIIIIAVFSTTVIILLLLVMFYYYSQLLLLSF